MTDSKKIEDAAFNAQQDVWTSLFHLSMAHKFGTPGGLAEARRYLSRAVASIDAAAPVNADADVGVI